MPLYRRNPGSNECSVEVWPGVRRRRACSVNRLECAPAPGFRKTDGGAYLRYAYPEANELLVYSPSP